MRYVYVAIVAFLVVAARAQSTAFRALKMQNNTDTLFEQYALRLAEPDNAEKATAWQGPLKISRGEASCTAEVSMVNAIYASNARSFVIVISASGSSTSIHFIDLSTCSAKWPAIKHFTSGVRFEGTRLLVLPACESRGKHVPSLCTSARVFKVEETSPPLLLRSESYRLTAKELGVGFTGEGKVLDPRTPKAMLVQ